VVATQSSLTFFSKDDVEKLGSNVWTDQDEWGVGTLLSFDLRQKV